MEVATFFGCETIQTNSFTPPLEFVGEIPYADPLASGQCYRVKVDPAFRWDDLWGWVTDSIGACADEADRASLRLCLEPRAGEIVSNTDSLLRLIDAVEADNLGAVLDTCHQHAQKEILPLSVEKLNGRVYAVHVSDSDGQTDRQLALGRGTVDWDGLFLALKKHGFSGFVGVDVGAVPDVDAQIRESKTYLEELAGRLSM